MEWSSKSFKKIRKLEKAIMVKDYVDKLLTSCKSWTGPCTSSAELKQVIKENPDKQETILAGQTEIALYSHT